MEDTRFEITDELGNKKILNALALIDDPNEDNHYIIYTDNTLDENNEQNIFVSLVVRDDDDNFSLEEITDIEDTARELSALSTVFYSGHCTGQKAMDLMKLILGEQIVEMHSGDIYDI